MLTVDGMTKNWEKAEAQGTVEGVDRAAWAGKAAREEDEADVAEAVGAEDLEAETVAAAEQTAVQGAKEVSAVD